MRKSPRLSLLSLIAAMVLPLLASAQVREDPLQAEDVLAFVGARHKAFTFVHDG